MRLGFPTFQGWKTSKACSLRLIKAASVQAVNVSLLPYNLNLVFGTQLNTAM
jgi:hypothetical protein